MVALQTEKLLKPGRGRSGSIALATITVGSPAPLRLATTLFGDLLQEGTATMYPIPESELLEQGIPHYTFGGVENAGQRGTASGANSWKNLRAKIAAGN
mgnify:CR=1 FL=1